MPLQTMSLFDNPHHTLTHLARIVAVETGDPVGQVLTRSLEEGGTLGLAYQLARRLTEEKYAHALPLRQLAVVANRAPQFRD